MWIAWNINSDRIRWPPSTIEEKAEIFYQRTRGWQLHIADLLANGGQPLGGSDVLKPLDHSGFAVLHICLSYFETIGHYEHRAQGAEGFKRGVKAVLPRLATDYNEEVFDELLSRLYRGARCGLYHNSMTAPGVGLAQPPSGAPIAYDPAARRLVVSPERLTRALGAHLEEFRARLLDSGNVGLRQNFEIRFNLDNGIRRGR